MKRQADVSLMRYETVKRRRLSKSVNERNKEPDEFAEDNDDVNSGAETTKSVEVQATNSMSSVEVQTDLNLISLATLEQDYQQALKRKPYPTQECLKEDEKLLTFYTGLTSITVFTAVFKFVSSVIPQTYNNKLTKFECFIVTLMNLRLGLSNYDLAFRFSISESTVGRVFSKWISAMDIRLSPLIKWPDHESLQTTMPFCFRRHYGLKVASIIDCFELFIEKPSNLLAKACTWSSYKHYNTAKYLIGITPQGTVSYVSKGWGGRVSDKYITEHCGYLNNLLPGDVVLADRGFDIGDSVGLMGATLDIPAFTRGRDQLTAGEIERTRKIANVRIHVERIIGVIRQRYTILSATEVLSKDFVTTKVHGCVLLDAVVRVCCALNNLCQGIVPFD